MKKRHWIAIISMFYALFMALGTYTQGAGPLLASHFCVCYFCLSWAWCAAPAEGRGLSQ
jgi:hypothetical protein